MCKQIQTIVLKKQNKKPTNYLLLIISHTLITFMFVIKNLSSTMNTLYNSISTILLSLNYYYIK